MATMPQLQRIVHKKSIVPRPHTPKAPARGELNHYIPLPVLSPEVKDRPSDSDAAFMTWFACAETSLPISMCGCCDCRETRHGHD
jgi:hypothetical protein